MTNAAQLKTIGQVSDELIRILAELYGFPTKKGFTDMAISANLFSLSTKLVELDKDEFAGNRVPAPTRQI